MASSVRLLVCEHLERDARAAIAKEDYPDVQIETYPARCGRPPLTWEDLSIGGMGMPPLQGKGEMLSSQGDGADVAILGGCCVAGLRDPPATGQRPRVHWAEQCFYMLTDPGLVDQLLRKGAYLLTPGWLARWRHQLDEWGFGGERSSPEVRAFFRESASRLVLLDTGLDADSARQLRAFAEFVDRPFERLPVGLGYLCLYLDRIILQWRLDQEKAERARPEPAEGEAAQRELQRQVADYAMGLDLAGSLTHAQSEAEAVQGILDLFAMLYAPRDLALLLLREDGAEWVLPAFSTPADEAQARALLGALGSNGDRPYAWTDSGEGFFLRLAHRGEMLGVLQVEQIAFPEYREHYLNLALGLSGVCGLAIDNARSYQQIRAAEASLREYSERLEGLAEERARQLIVAQERLVRREKLAMLGQMAGSVSHELRNPLGAIQTAAYCLRDTLGDAQGSVLECLEIIEGRVRHATKIVHDLLDSVRIGPTDRQVAGVVVIVLSTLGKSPPPEGIETITDVPDDLPDVLVDSQQIEQVLTNLLSNAYEAMPAGGTLTLRASAQDREVVIAVADTGVGISLENRDKLFEPLYTTKRQGTGLGLAICRGLMEANGGWIEVESEEGVGSTFSISLPLAEGA